MQAMHIMSAHFFLSRFIPILIKLSWTHDYQTTKVFWQSNLMTAIIKQHQLAPARTAIGLWELKHVKWYFPWNKHKKEKGFSHNNIFISSQLDLTRRTWQNLGPKYRSFSSLCQTWPKSFIRTALDYLKTNSSSIKWIYSNYVT